MSLSTWHESIFQQPKLNEILKLKNLIYSYNLPFFNELKLDFRIGINPKFI